MLAFLIILLTLIVLTIINLRKLSKIRPKNFPPGPSNLPIWGGYWWLLLANYKFTHKAVDYLTKYYKSNIVGFLAGVYPVVMITSHDLAKETLTRPEFTGRPDFYASRYRSLGDLLGIIFTDGPFWKEQRRFSLRQLRDFGFGRRFSSTEDLFESETKSLIEYLNSKPNSDDYDIHRKKGQVLIPDVFYGPLSNSILHMLVGRRFEDKELRELARSTLRFLRDMDATGRAISLTPWLRHIAPNYFGSTTLIKENQRMRDFCLKMIEERKLTFSDDHHGDFLDTFISKMHELHNEGVDESFTEKQLIWVLADYLFPAPNVIGPSLNMLWAHLCMYPEVQVKVQEEIDLVVGRSRLPNLDDRKNMPYTEAVLRESLRMDPVVPINTPRRCTEDTTLAGYSIPKDTVVLISIWGANHDTKIWDNPTVFKPERFLDEDGNLLKKDLILTFGAGKRLCAGETFARNSMFLLLSGLLQNFTFKPADGMPDVNDKKWGFVVDIPAHWVDAIGR